VPPRAAEDGGLAAVAVGEPGEPMNPSQ